MEIIRCWEEKGLTTAEPHKRHAKVFFAPDKRDVPEFTFSYVYIYPNSSSVPHKHDRPELVLVLSGRGIVICDDVEVSIEPDMVLLFRPGETHQFINNGEEMIKSAAFFAPAYSERDLLQGITSRTQP